MAESDNKMFTLMVVSNTPDEVIKKYDATKKVEPYIKYYYKDAKKYRKSSIKMAQDVIDNADKLGCNDVMKDYFKEKLQTLKSMSDFEYYTYITNGLTYDNDGNAISEENPDGKWSSCSIGKNLCIPLELKSGGQSLQAKAGEVDWEKMNKGDVEGYTKIWKLYHKEIEPETNEDKQIYENIKYQKRYFEEFNSLDDFLAYSCSYWCYAYADDEKWVDADSHKNFDWITSFYDKFIKPLKDDDLVTIYECQKA